MAKMDFSGVDEMLEDLRKLADDSEDACEEMLDAGAEVLVESWKDVIKSNKHVDTGAMFNSVAAKRKTRGTLRLREIYPQGKDSKGVRNAEKAYIIHYGTSKRLGDRFVTTAEEKGEEAATEAMLEKYHEILDKHNL